MMHHQPFRSTSSSTSASASTAASQPLAFPERSFIVQRRDNEPVAFEPVYAIEHLMSTAERQYQDMEAMTRGAVEDWTIDTAEHVHVVERGQHVHGQSLRDAPDQQQNTPNFNNAWEHQPQHQNQHRHPPLIYAMHNQHQQHQYPPINPAYDPSFYPSSTDGTPPSGFYINTHHNNPQNIQPQHGGQSYPHQILSPTSSTSTTDPDSEQKRLRNTAASARFRAKKKRREQSLERSSTEKRQQVQRLENRVGELEEENRWLKDLVWERGSVRERKEKELKERDEKEEDMGKKEGERNDGVGTN